MAVPGAEIVDGYPDAALPQPGEDVPCPVPVVHQELFRGAGRVAAGENLRIKAAEDTAANLVRRLNFRLEALNLSARPA